ncbi:ERF recombination protein [Lactococcus phage Q54]|uniref:ERF recombination protein n=1 Tax=Lactococcus phage Q54 TaxID=382685 RepID=Q0GXW1_9CAUD|nr:Erf-like ssDNA annealing protein [Lactococcus phage Q54]ABF22565.1 ERF recombination protein [Lactococcus phage Q54]
MKNLNKAREELKANKSQYNSFGKYNYRNVEDIQEALKPLLVKHDLGLWLDTDIFEMAGMLWLKLVGEVTDGEDVKESTVKVPFQKEKKGMSYEQAFGATLSYAAKYLLGLIFLLDDTKDEDAVENNDNYTYRKEQEQKELEAKAEAANKKKAIARAAQIGYPDVEKLELLSYDQIVGVMKAYKLEQQEEEILTDVNK